MDHELNIQMHLIGARHSKPHAVAAPNVAAPDSLNGFPDARAVRDTAETDAKVPNGDSVETPVAMEE